MSDAWAAVRFPDGAVRYTRYQGSSDILHDVLFATVEEAWTAECTSDFGPHDGPTVPVRIYSDYGYGSSWDGVALADMSRVVAGLGFSCSGWGTEDWDQPNHEYHGGFKDSTPTPEWVVLARRPAEPSKEQWDGAGWVEGECGRCGERGRVEWRPDPFVAEVYPEDDPVDEWWCRPCWRRRKEDV